MQHIKGYDHMTKGYLHLYYGDGKGKTTAVIGLSCRALGHGKKVVMVFFLKSGKSGEVKSMEKLGATVLYGKAGDSFRVSDMSEEEKDKNKKCASDNLMKALSEECDILVLDELCAACENGMIDEELIKGILDKRATGTEIIITGRKPAEWMLVEADYITHMLCDKHPHDMGLLAREGIEY